MTTTKQVPNYKEEKLELQANLATMISEASLNVFNTDADQLGLDFASPLKLAVGDQSPLFQLPNAVNKIIALEDLLNAGPVVITFYRGNWCPYCNIILNAYQRILPDIKALGANLIAISSQNPDSSLDMQAKHNLEFEVLSDKSRDIPVPAVFVIDKNGTIIFAKTEGGDYRLRVEPAEILNALKK